MTTSNNGHIQTVTDTESIDTFDVQANALGWPHDDLHLVNDADVQRVIRAVLRQQKNDFIGVSSISVDADQDPTHLYGVLCTMASTGIGNQATMDVHWKHPSGEALDVNLKMIGCHFVVTMEGAQAKMTGEVRTVKNQ